MAVHASSLGAPSAKPDPCVFAGCVSTTRQSHMSIITSLSPSLCL